MSRYLRYPDLTVLKMTRVHVWKKPESTSSTLQTLSTKAPAITVTTLDRIWTHLHSVSITAPSIIPRKSNVPVFTPDYVIRNIPWSQNVRSESQRNLTTTNSQSKMAAPYVNMRLLATWSLFSVIKKSLSVKPNIKMPLLNNTFADWLVRSNKIKSLRKTAVSVLRVCVIW